MSPRISSWGPCWSRDGHVLLDKAYGSANLECDIPNSPKFRMGSMAKQFTAASILLLEGHGKLNVNEP